jgi:hypothetical protein
MSETRPRRFQISIRMLMLACAVVAILLTPVAWVARERQRLLMLQREILMAREVALASAIREEKSRHAQAVAAAASASAEELKCENAALRTEVEKLHRELGRLKQQANAGPTGH